MSFDDLAPQPPIFPPEAEAYSRRALELSREAAGRCDATFDVAYGPDPRQRLDVYRSRSVGGERLPVLLFIHGGGWTNGYKEWVGLLAPAVTSFPAIFVSVACRLAPVHRFPVPFEDCVRAIAWVHRNVAVHGGDPERIHVGGHSSGGHLTSLAALRRDKLRAEGLPDSVIRACFPVSARFDMVFVDPPPGSVEHRHQSVLFSPGEDTRLASPFHLVAGCRVPFLVTYGDRDIPSIVVNGERMFAALRESGAAAERLVLEGHDHFDTAIEIRHPDGPWMTAVKQWMVGGALPRRPVK